MRVTMKPNTEEIPLLESQRKALLSELKKLMRTQKPDEYA
jgi:hypothetical protein